MTASQLVAGHPDCLLSSQACDRVVQAGCYIYANTGSATKANETPLPRQTQASAMDAAACIACVAACKNASAMLFVGAQIPRFALLTQERAERMVAQMASEPVRLRVPAPSSA